MGYPDSGLVAEPDPRQRAAEEAFRAGLRAGQARRDVQVAQRSAAASMDRSADSHERTAIAYERAADRGGPHHEEYRERAIRHRGFAHEDREMARRLRDDSRY